MSDILAVFSIVAVSLAAITIVIRLLPLLMLAALVLLAVWSSFLRNRPQDLSCISSTFSASCPSHSPSVHITSERFCHML
jgi:hypothetical protein